MPTLTTPHFEFSVLSEHHLQTLVSLSGAVAAAHALPEVLDLAADAARGVLTVDSLSISRFELDAGLLRTLIVSEDGISEDERHPAEETYPLSDFPKAFDLLLHGRPHVNSVDDEGADPAELALLAELGMESSAAVPIVYGGAAWGELFVSTRSGRPRVARSDVAFLQAVAAQLAIALGRAEQFAHVSRAAYEDQLTGLANRRAFEDRLAAAVETARGTGGSALTLVLGDLDGLKRINDSSGHVAGDDALRAVGRALARETPAGALAARVGGDEFCALLPGFDARDGEALASAVSARLAASEPPLHVAWGLAAFGGPVTGARELLRAADEAQYEVKRRGRGGRGRTGARQPVTAVPTETADLLTTCLGVLDAVPHASREERLRRLGDALAAALRSPRWLLLHRDHGSEEVATWLVCDQRLRGTGTVAFDDRRRPAATFPALQRLMSRPASEVVVLGRAPADPSPERLLLGALGLVAVAGGSAATAEGIDGLVLYADERTLALAPAAPLVRLLLAAV